jgi:DNA-binding response OmpR family regulator
MVRALVVEDEDNVASFLKRGLESEGLTVEVVRDGRRALELASSSDFDVILLDLILPGLSGEQVLRELRARGSTVPVIVLTAKDAVWDRVTNLEAGADDYLTKPFSFAELLARIRARLRTPAGAGRTVLSCGDVTLDLDRRRARVRDRTVELTAREFALLETFMRHPGHVLSQAQLLDQVWGYSHDPRSNVVEVYVRSLRRKLGREAIETVRGLGYRLREGTPTDRP